MFKKYCSHRPKNLTTDATPMSNPKSDVWFKNQPIGVHTLANTVKRLCEKELTLECRNSATECVELIWWRVLQARLDQWWL